MSSSGVSRFRKLSKQTSFLVSPGDASEDGDFVALRQTREKKREVLKSLKSSLETISESPRKVSQSEIKIQEIKRTDPKELLRDKLFKFLEEGKDDEIKKCIENNVPASIADLTSDAYRKPHTKENILHVALFYKRVDIACYLIEKIQDSAINLLLQSFEITLASAHGFKNVLHLATELHNMSLVQLIVGKIKSNAKLMTVLQEESPVQIQGQRPRTFPCVHLSSFLGFTDLVEYFLKCGVGVNHLNQKKDSALLWAARWGHTDTVRFLLQKGADPGIENDKGSTALYWAVRYGHATTVKLLLAEGKADPRQTRKLGLVAPIVLASALGYDEIVNALLDNGANVNHVIRGKETPIHHAAREGHVDVLNTLLRRGAEYEKPDERGDTALLLGAKFGYSDIVQTLIQHGANMKQKNFLGEDIWMHTVNNSEHFAASLIEVLVHMGLLVSPEKNNGEPIRINCSKSPLFHAAVLGRCDKIENFLNLNLDPAEPDEDGNTFLMVAAINDKQKVISQFHKLVNIDAQNNRGNTALHIACLHGLHDTIITLIDKKAKANIKNKNGETALHVAAYSKAIRPHTVQKLINHVIKTHAWESLNVPDGEGKNPLHIAAQFALPDILWEFRFIRYKDLDVNGNNALHAAVRPKHEEAFLVMMDIYETMKRDADINQQNVQQESVLHLAASECFGNGVRKLVLFGADLSLQDSNGDTVLHRLTRASIDDPDNIEKYLEVFDIVIEESVRWWCIKHDIEKPDDRQELKRYKRKAVLQLTKNIFNSKDLSVLALACTLGAAEIIEKITQMKDVLYFETVYKNSTINRRYDITHLTPLTNNSVTGLCNNTVVPRPAYIEWLLSTENPESASYILDLPPMAYIENSYTSIAAWTYVVIMTLHITYMTIFSYTGVTLQDSIRTNTTNNEFKAADILFYFVVIEPAIIILYLCYELVKHWCLGEQTMKVKLKRGRSTTLQSFLNPFGTLVHLSYAVLVIVWMILHGTGSVYQTYFLSVSLGLGWMNSIVFTKGFKLIHYFWKMIQNMVLKDVSKFIFVYLFVLLAFSFAFHVVFQVSNNLVEDYSNPGHTMFLLFNLMLGMDEIFTDSFETNMAEAGYTTVFPKVIYMFYMVLGTIVLLNLLIAMMNDSYSQTLKKQQLLWRIESVQLGINIEKMLPFTTWLFSRVKLHRKSIVADDDETDTWYIEVTSSVSKTKRSLDKETELINHINNRITALDTKLSDEMKSFHNTLQDISTMLQKRSETSGISERM